MLQGWQRYKNHPDPRIRERFTRQVKKLIGAYNAALWVMEREFKKVNRGVSQQIHQLRREVEKEFPVVALLTAASLGPSCCGLHAGRRSGSRQDVLTNLQPFSNGGTGFRLRRFRPLDIAHAAMSPGFPAPVILITCSRAAHHG